MYDEDQKWLFLIEVVISHGHISPKRWIELNPAFQRVFRWKEEQKTKLIESILIGIPIPQIFVSQKANGTWNVVDGVQRLYTIFQLLGIVENGNPLQLSPCKYLPELMDKKW